MTSQVKAIEGFVFVSIQFTVRHHRIPWLRILSLLRGDALTNSSVSFEPKQRKQSYGCPHVTSCTQDQHCTSRLRQKSNWDIKGEMRGPKLLLGRS